MKHPCEKVITHRCVGKGQQFMLQHCAKLVIITQKTWFPSVFFHLFNKNTSEMKIFTPDSMAY